MYSQLTLQLTVSSVSPAGNITVLGVYIPHPSSFSRVFILWLAVVDLVACCVGTPLLVFSLFHPYMFPSGSVCKTLRFVHVQLVATSVFIFVCIAYERHRAICNMEVVEMKTRRMHAMCLVSIILGIVVAAPAIFLYGIRTVKTGVYNITGTECFVEDYFEKADSIWPKIYFPFQSIIVVISFVFMVVMYIRIGRQLQWHIRFTKRYSTTSRLSQFQSSKSRQSLVGDTTLLNKSLNVSESQPMTGSRNSLHVPIAKTQSTPTSRVTRAAHEMTTMFMWLTCVFIISFIPHLAIIIYAAFRPSFTSDMTPASVVTYNIFLRTFAINNMANPLVYLACTRDFRRDCKAFFCKIVSCGRR